jgi:hypothetical protein
MSDLIKKYCVFALYRSGSFFYVVYRSNGLAFSMFFDRFFDLFIDWDI